MWHIFNENIEYRRCGKSKKKQKQARPRRLKLMRRLGGDSHFELGDSSPYVRVERMWAGSKHTPPDER